MPTDKHELSHIAAYGGAYYVNKEDVCGVGTLDDILKTMRQRFDQEYFQECEAIFLRGDSYKDGTQYKQRKNREACGLPKSFRRV
jgi:hypothetical protein